MEQLLHYCWKHKMWPMEGLQTTDGRVVEVVDPGLHNRNSGPDFFNAKIKIGGTLWVGNVEIHDKSSDWYAHGHHTDVHYNNVVLHVVGIADREIQTAEGNFVPQMLLTVPQSVHDHYAELLRTDHYPPCYKIIPNLTRLMVHSWMAALQTERLEQKTTAICERAELAGGSWEDAFFMTLARNYGFGVNGDAFEEWARHIPLQAVGKHRDDLFQVEAIFMGQAGLLDLSAIPARYQQDALNEGYFAKLRNEYQYLAHKFSLKPMDVQLWRFLRLRPQNFPHIRISQLANLYYGRKASLSALIDCKDMVSLADTLHLWFGEHPQHEAFVVLLHPSAPHQHLRPHAFRLWPPQSEGRAVRPCLRLPGAAEGREQPYCPYVARMRTVRTDGWRLSGAHPAEA